MNKFDIFVNKVNNVVIVGGGIVGWMVVVVLF